MTPGMKVNAHRAEAALYLRLDDAPVVESERIAPGTILTARYRA